jgi:hypothetical protein
MAAPVFFTHTFSITAGTGVDVTFGSGEVRRI